MAQNPMVDVLRYYGSPVNRQEYINTAYMGKPPARLDPESEAELPQNDSRFMAFRPTTHEEVAAEEVEKEAKKPTTPGAAPAPKPAPIQMPDIYVGGPKHIDNPTGARVQADTENPSDRTRLSGGATMRPDLGQKPVMDIRRTQQAQFAPDVIISNN